MEPCQFGINRKSIMRPATKKEIDAALHKLVDNELPDILKQKGLMRIRGINTRTIEGKLLLLRLAEQFDDIDNEDGSLTIKNKKGKI
jgi:hypothetical protein